jgi:hypothetical protein
VLYPHEVQEGRRVPVDLQRYPRARSYLESHRELLEARAYVRQAGRRWYEVWVPQDPGLWGRPKVVFPDIAEEPRAYLDRSDAVVQGDCYWITMEPRRDEDGLLLALAVLNSTLATAFYDARSHNKLYAGRRRYLTQYVEEFPVPPSDHPAARAAVRLARRLAGAVGGGEERSRLEQEVDRLVWSAFDLTTPRPA